MYYNIKCKDDNNKLQEFMKSEGIEFEAFDNPYPLVIRWEVKNILEGLEDLEGINENILQFTSSSQFKNMCDNYTWIESNTQPIIEEHMIAIIDSNPEFSKTL